MSCTLIAAAAAVFLISVLQPTFCSYLDYPRIHFSGKYRVDTNAINNSPCNFRMDRELAGRYAETNLHNFGSNSFQFFDTAVSGITELSGRKQSYDPIVGQPIVNNVDLPFAKIVDLDVDCQGRSAIYGMQFGVQGNSGLLFYGKWTPSIIALNMLPRVACFSDIDDCELIYSPGGESFSAQSMTTITDIEWNLEPEMGSFLEDFKAVFDASGMDKLVVRITQYAFRYGGDDASLGHVVGVIGIPSDTDTQSVPGDRFMLPTANDPVGLDYEKCEMCIYNGGNSSQSGTPWMAPAPFKVDLASEEVHVDLSLSFIMDNSLNIRDIGTLQFGIFYEEVNCVELIQYELHNYWFSLSYRLHGAMYDRKLHTAQLVEDIKNNPLVLVQVSTVAGGQSKPICSDQALPSMKSSASDSVVILLKEEPYFIRSKGLYVGRFDQTDEYPNPNMQEVYITKFGVPAKDVTPTVSLSKTVTGEPPVPEDGVLAEYLEYDETTGIAKFSFSRNRLLEMPALREYGDKVCSDYDGDTRTALPIDGQVYYFSYSIEEHDFYCPTKPVFLSHTHVQYTRPYTWVRDVSPILSMFARIAPMMKTILDMSSYTDMTRPHNINIMDRALRLDFYDPSYMPTTRNLSPAKRNMILEWLAYPLYNNTCKPQGIIVSASRDGGIDIPDIPDRCNASELKFNESPATKDSRLYSFYKTREYSRCSSTEISKASNSAPIPERPLFLHKNRGKNAAGRDLRRCSKENITQQLQTALRLEWSTIPVYLTSLYSIMDGCNVEIYDLIRNIVMQEMLHFALVGNMLIALGEVPQIDHPTITPSYPGKLPACVIPELEVTLEKLSRKHIHDVFMVIELPVETEVGGDLNYSNIYTIGAFYNEIKGCLQERLDEGEDEIFDNTTVDYQVKWPYWGSLSRVGNLVPILNTSSAIEAINVIVSQGEGATMLTPKDIDDATLAHFFRFEQIYCKRRIEKKEDGTYAYSGYQIPFNSHGIFNMRPNPTTDNVPINTICYTESRMFHLAYRNFLRQLQLAFNGRPSDGEDAGEPQDFFVAVQLMEALQLNAKRLMRIEFNSSDHTTCGPVWDYEWEGELPDNH